MGDFNFAIQSESELDNVLNALEQGTFEDKVLPAGEYQVVIYDYKMDRTKKTMGTGYVYISKSKAAGVRQ